MLLGPLDRVGWLADQPMDFQNWVRNTGQLRTFGAGQYIFAPGDQPDGIYGLKSGSMEIEFPLIAEEMVSLLLTGEGFWIGDAALLTNVPRILSVVAVHDSEFLYLSGGAIQKILIQKPEYWPSFYDLNTRNATLAVKLLAEVLSLTVRARVCRSLLRLSENRKEARVTQDKLAKTLGIALPTLRRCLTDLVSRGAIQNNYGRVTILRKDVLKKFKDEQ